MDTALWSMANLNRLRTIQQYRDGVLTQAAAAEQVGLSTRQLRRLLRVFEQDGPSGLLHGNRGRVPVHRKDERLRTQIRSLLTARYAGLPPTHAWEKLTERHGICVSDEWLRIFMTMEQLWTPRRRRAPPIHRTWRPRRETYGQLVQFDGSYHRWFEDRAPEACLLAAIDDATGQVPMAQFLDHEGVIPVFTFWRIYTKAHGKPLAVYVDRFSTYRDHGRERTGDPDLQTQFELAMGDLGIRAICARSPQAKGRVERLFGTLQERLVAELRLAGISDTGAANSFLVEQFLPNFNARFGVEAAQPGDAHRPLTAQEHGRLDGTFSIQETRTIRNDYTIAYCNRWYQILPTSGRAIRPDEEVTVERRLDGSIHLRLRDRYLRYDILPKRPQRDPLRFPWVLTEATAPILFRPLPTPPTLIMTEHVHFGEKRT